MNFWKVNAVLSVIIIAMDAQRARDEGTIVFAADVFGVMLWSLLLFFEWSSAHSMLSLNQFGICQQ
jgi:hypothetical protein